jgi:hemolysin activation/secretion protein
MHHGIRREDVGQCSLSLAALLLLSWAGAVHAQAPTTPSPEVRQQGEQQERLQREREEAQRGLLKPAPKAPPPSSPEPIKPWPENESPCLPLREVVLVGDSSQSFQWTIEGLLSGSDPAIGRCLGREGVNGAASRAQQALMERGYVTSRIVFREQNIASGRLTLTLLPGRIGAIRFAQADPRANALNAVPTRPGAILNLRNVEQALENFKRVPSVEADIQIDPADAPDQSDLVIVWRQAFPFRFNATLDDSGSKSTGKYQSSATLSYDHWWTLNDLFYVTLNQDLGGGQPGKRGTRGHAVHYSVPMDFWLLGLTQSANRYHQSVAGLNQDYVYSSRSENAEIKLSRLLHRNASQKSSASLKGWLRRSSNLINDTEVETQRRATGGWELGLAHKAFIGSGTLDVNLAHKRGTAAFGAIPAPEEAFGRG